MIGSLRTNRQPRNCAGVRLLIDRYIKLRLHGSQFNFVDAFAAFRDWEIQNPDEASEFTQGLEKEAVTEFAKNPITANLVRDLAFAYFRPEQFPSHSALIEQLLYNPRGGAREREDDKRVLMLETEFSRLLAVCARSGNTLSEVLRQAFDSSKHLVSNTKSDHCIATHPHISLIGHITPTELKERMNDISYSNGFANRILWVEAYSSKSLPFGGIPDWYAQEKLIINLRNVVAWAKERHVLCNRAMRVLQHGKSRYNKRDNERGITGALLQRDRTHLLRLAMIYAILDGRVCINENHLKAALSVWHYSAQTVRRLFGNMKGSTVAEKIYDFILISGEVSMREIYDHLSRNVSSSEIQMTILGFEVQGLVRTFMEKSGSKKVTKVKIVDKGEYT